MGKVQSDSFIKGEVLEAMGYTFKTGYSPEQIERMIGIKPIARHGNVILYNRDEVNRAVATWKEHKTKQAQDRHEVRVASGKKAAASDQGFRRFSNADHEMILETNRMVKHLYDCLTGPVGKVTSVCSDPPDERPGPIPLFPPSLEGTGG